jgi:hypothetical protein
LWNGSFKSVRRGVRVLSLLVDARHRPRAAAVRSRSGGGAARGRGRDSGAGAWVRPCAVLLRCRLFAVRGRLGLWWRWWVVEV